MDRKVALVTGASGGIGRSICERLAKDGMNLVINYRTNKDKAEDIGEFCKSQGVDFVLIKADISKESEVEEIFDIIIKMYGRLDVLVNNAGITRDNLIMKMTSDEFKEVVNVNMLSGFYTMKKASRIMLKQKSGSIINISSVVGIRGNIAQVNYSASKAGLIGITKSLAKELGRKNIRVNAVAPGFIETKMTEGLGKKIKTSIEKDIPLGRLGRAEDVADLVEFLASDRSSYITGQVISVDGGMNI